MGKVDGGKAGRNSECLARLTVRCAGKEPLKIMDATAELAKLDGAGWVRDHSRMTVKLDEQTRELVEAQFEESGFASVDEMVNRIVQERLAVVEFDDSELADSLIAAFRSPRHVYVEGAFLERGKRRLAERKASAV